MIFSLYDYYYYCIYSQSFTRCTCKQSINRKRRNTLRTTISAILIGSVPGCIKMQFCHHILMQILLAFNFEGLFFYLTRCGFLFFYLTRWGFLFFYLMRSYPSSGPPNMELTMFETWRLKFSKP